MLGWALMVSWLRRSLRASLWGWALLVSRPRRSLRASLLGWALLVSRLRGALLRASLWWSTIVVSCVRRVLWWLFWSIHIFLTAIFITIIIIICLYIYS